jgi:alcohol dehydrogenase, propanol-preferring
VRAAILGEPGAPLQLVDLPVPRPGQGEILIRLEASGVCHTDVHVWQGHYCPARPPAPFVMGHEGVGRVAALGDGVTDWAVGDRAGAAWQHEACGDCVACRTGQEGFCQAQRAHGYDVPGTFAEYVVAKAAFAARLPEGDAAALAPLMCAGLTALGALDRAGLRHGEDCAVFGCGGLGQYAVQLARRRGARVHAVDTDPGKRALAMRHGATSSAAPQTDGPGRIADAVINFAPTARAWPAMQHAVRPLGRIVAAAMVDKPVALRQDWLTGNGVTISGTSVGTRAQMRDLLALHKAEPLQAEIERIGLGEVTAALTSLAEGRAKGRYCIIF